MTRKQIVELADARRFLKTGEARRIREAAGLSQGELAAQIGVTPSTLSRWESGERRPVGRPAVAYARLLSDLSERDVVIRLACQLKDRSKAACK